MMDGLAGHSNAAVRRAMVVAINQKDEMIAAMSEDPSSWRVPVGYTGVAVGQ